MLSFHVKYFVVAVFLRDILPFISTPACKVKTLPVCVVAGVSSGLKVTSLSLPTETEPPPYFFESNYATEADTASSRRKAIRSVSSRHLGTLSCHRFFSRWIYKPVFNKSLATVPSVDGLPAFSIKSAFLDDTASGTRET